MCQAFHGGRLLDAAGEFGLPPEAIVDFSMSVNVLAPEIPCADWEKWRVEITRYPEADAGAIRTKLAEVHGVDSAHVLPAAGGIEALYLAARLFGGLRAGVVEPAFSDYHRAFQGAGCEPRRIVLDRTMWHAPISSWKSLLDGLDVVVLGNPNNPTGAFQTRAELLDLLARPRPGLKAMIVDEAFIELAAPHEKESLLAVVGGHPQLIVVRSLTKSWRIPGLRLGFLATSNADWIGRLRAMQPPWSINAVAQAWAGKALTPSNYARLLSGLRDLSTERDRFAGSLSEIPGIRVYPAAANFLLVELPDPPSIDASHIYIELGRRGMLVRVCDSFYGMPKGRFIRLAVRTGNDNDRLARELAAACAALKRKAA